MKKMKKKNKTGKFAYVGANAFVHCCNGPNGRFVTDILKKEEIHVSTKKRRRAHFTLFLIIYFFLFVYYN